MDQQQLYLIGRYLGKDAVYKFAKEGLSAVWLTTFDNITNINAYAQHPNGEYLYLGADYLLDPYFEGCNSCLTCRCVSAAQAYCMAAWNPAVCYDGYVQAGVVDDFWTPVDYGDDGSEACEECEEEEDTTWHIPPMRVGEYGAAVVAMTRDGKIRWQLKLQGNNDRGNYTIDRCMGIVYNELTNQITALLTSQSNELL